MTYEFRIEHYGFLGWEVTAYEVLPDDRGIGERVAYVQRRTKRGAIRAAMQTIKSPPSSPKPTQVWTERVSI